jgi:hypothetical protein
MMVMETAFAFSYAIRLSHLESFLSEDATLNTQHRLTHPRQKETWISIASKVILEKRSNSPEKTTMDVILVGAHNGCACSAVLML